jgi:hypothetical protein
LLPSRIYNQICISIYHLPRACYMPPPISYFLMWS